jgi:hypothetical protein
MEQHCGGFYPTARTTAIPANNPAIDSTTDSST